MTTDTHMSLPIAETTTRPGTIPGSELVHLLRYAIQAPSSHNSQPWRYRVRDGRIDIHANLDRWLRVADADRRELHISLGCAIENLLIAIEHQEWGAAVRYLPDPSREDFIASVTVTRFGMRSRHRPAELFDAIDRRRTNHGRYADHQIGEDLLDRLRACVVDPELRLVLVSDEAFHGVAEAMVLAADVVQFSNPAYRQELAHWIGQGAFGTPWLMSRLGRLAMAHLDLSGHYAERDAELMRSAPVFGVLLGRDDSRRTQILAGQTFERIFLMATALGLALQPMSQLVQVEDFRAELSSLLGGPGWRALQPFRLGYAPSTEEKTPRLSVEEVAEVKECRCGGACSSAEAEAPGADVSEHDASDVGHRKHEHGHEGFLTNIIL